MTITNLNLCKNCKHWRFCGVTNEEDNYRPCVNSACFTKEPDTLSDARSLLSKTPDKAVVKPGGFFSDSGTRSAYILTGSNFGCVHFEATKP